MNCIESDRTLVDNTSSFDSYGESQNSSANAWNVNFNNANVNNNSRTNTNRVRAVAELPCSSLDDPEVPFDTLIEAYYHCRQNKRGKPNAVLYEMDWSHDLYKLWREVVERRYEISRSICFVVTQPKPREVFAADFRDRIIHHWIAIRLEPLLDKYLPGNMCSNRKGYGTAAAVRQAYNIINDGQDGVIYKFDIQGFFMAIDKRILCDRLLTFIAEHYNGCDLDTLLYLTEKVVMHCPQDYCTFHSPRKMWSLLPANKSLFSQDKFHGLAIGNLTSQMFANFYLSGIIRGLNHRGIRCVQYVDDIFSKVKDDAQQRTTEAYVREELAKVGLTLHPKKKYIQPVSHGVSFIGCVICRGRIYPGGRCLDRVGGMLHRGATPESLNSYFGLLRMLPEMRSYRIRRKMAMSALAQRDDIYIVGNRKAVLKKEVRPMNIMINRIKTCQY